MLWTSFLLLGAVQLAASKAISRRWDDVAEKHSWVEVPKGWQFKQAADPNVFFNLKLGLKQHGMDDLIANLMEISDPFHSRYAQHLTKEEVDNFLAPHPDSLEAVEEWLAFHGIDTSEAQRTSAGNWITLRVSVEQAERMLNTKYNVYEHGPSGEEVIRTLSYSLPQELHSHIDVVAPTTYFGTLRSMRKTSFLQPDVKPITDEELAASLVPGSNAAVPSSCSTTITPTCLRDLYNSSAYVPQATATNKLGVAGYLQEFANLADLQTFFSRFRTDAVGSSFSIVQVNGGGNNQNSPGVEANLDIQYTTGISFPTPNIYYSTGGSPPFTPDSFTTSNTNEPYLDFLTFLLAQKTIPQTLTTSYGDDEQTVPLDYATSVCNMLATLGSLGTTVFYSSGDEGVGGGDCKTNDGTNKVQFQPAFPASCPFVTAVGATTRINPEVAISFSGGGFSRYFATPSYQTTAVNTFLNGLGTKFSGLFNKTGRAYPDVSAQGQGFQVVIGGRVQSVAGTSASSPTVAGIFSLLNDFRISQGKTSLGFINPLIYSTASSGFNDITSGSNPGCGQSGFTAGKGWDPVTGLGTPDFLKLQKLV
ncbi:putative tripeptidyl-peptidase SED2 [Psilocybe cubensis]|uniref:tripeptidyl-peptidase II n=2 Tax=Psilocybe cubensis TaxID=181762 RepID=A0A8H7XVX4_PSICU|nr:putative tripeptidyl-peptidase SED2 [Psilocybe cubensis]KAH9479704.1 putative tripeptidyl-peptidase SED2 [Psilocybe cubensis]